MSMALKYGMKKRMAKGGMAHQSECTEHCVQPCDVHMKAEMPMMMAEGGDMIEKIMKKRGYSEGGKVANDDEAFEAEFSEPNQFDELVKDDGLEFHDTGASSGDELGDHQEDMDRKDMVAKIMASRKKKDRNPRPA